MFPILKQVSHTVRYSHLCLPHILEIPRIFIYLSGNIAILNKILSLCREVQVGLDIFVSKVINLAYRLKFWV